MPQLPYARGLFLVIKRPGGRRVSAAAGPHIPDRLAAAPTRSRCAHDRRTAAVLALLFDLSGPPGLVEPRLQRTVEAKDYKPALTGDRLHPIVFEIGRRCWFPSTLVGSSTTNGPLCVSSQIQL